MARDLRMLQLIFDSVQVGMLLIDGDTAVIRVNDVMLQLAGKETPADLLHRQPGDGLGCIHSFHAGHGCGHAPVCAECPLRNAVRQVLDTGQEVRDLEITAAFLIAGETRQFTFSVSASLVHFDGARHALLSIVDMTERRKTEEALRASEARYRLLAENASDIVWTMGLSGRLTYISPSIEALTGFAPDEIQRMPPFEYLTPESSVLVKGILSKQLGLPPHERLARLTAELRHRRYPMTITIAVTGYASLFELSDCRDAGFEDYFTKPADLSQLMGAAEQAFIKLARWKER